MLSFLYSSGLRVSELVKLKPQDMRFEEKIGWVRSGKGGKDRMFILSEQLGKELQDYTKSAIQTLFSLKVNRSPRAMCKKNCQAHQSEGKH